ncbi:MAG: hypothetical protein LBV69_03560 [Bacteroidales bacterium]|jgi:hypothetical protein|nr:hypothetical protein [Bacteroidales bacterium]
MTKEMLNNFSGNLFWDTDPNDIDIEKHAKLIINRVLDYGMWEDWLFIRKYYGLEKIKNLALAIRSMERKSLAFISTMTQTPENEFRCYEQIQSKDTHWYF